MGVLCRVPIVGFSNKVVGFMFRHLHGAELPRVKKAIKCILTFGLVQMDKKGPSKLLFYTNCSRFCSLSFFVISILPIHVWYGTMRLLKAPQSLPLFGVVNTHTIANRQKANIMNPGGHKMK